MQYDPIKRVLGKFFNQSTFLRKVFYRLLDLLLLRAWHVHFELKRIFKDSEKKNLRILDAGSGFGQYSWYIKKKKPHWELVGLELKEEQVDDCNHFFRKSNVQKAIFKVADLVQYREEEGYNYILCVDVMEHIEEDTKVFENFCHSLSPGGKLIISTPSDQGGSGVTHEEDESFIEEHVRDGYNKEDISQKLIDAGFSIVKVRYTYGFWGSISWHLSMKYPILMLGKTKLFFISLPFYYLITFPFSLVFNYLDVHAENPTGTGLLVVAQK
jgi:2-polyprenyl-3-methyl-5-hydroxy-6-metoxy-1,4-benzoquinol methylase